MPRMTTTAAAAAALTLALTACGGDGGPGPTAGEGNSSTPAAPSTSDGDPNSVSPSSTSSAGTSSEGGSSSATSSSSAPSTSSTSTNTGTPFDPDEFTAKLEKAVDASSTVTIDVTVSSDGKQTVQASGRQDLADDSLEMDLETAGQQVTYRHVDGTYYLSQPPKWVPVTKDSSNPLIEQALDQVGMLSMRKQFDAFVAGVTDAGTKGSEKIDGTATTHYTATVDTTKALEAMDQKKNENTPDTVIYDVWLDEDDLIRQMAFTQQGAKATMTAKDWGKPLTIDKPKDSEIAQVPGSGTS